MAYNNSFFYDRDNSVDDKYKYVYDLSIYKPIYGSSVNYLSRLNFLQTIDNSLKVLPASENNLNITFNLKFLLDDDSVGNLLKTIEVAQGTKYLKFSDPSNIYKEFVGYVEKYAVNKTSANLSEVNITLNNYGISPEFLWRTSAIIAPQDVSFYREIKRTAFVPINSIYAGEDVWPPYYPGTSFDYKRHDVVYYSNYEAKKQNGGNNIFIIGINPNPNPNAQIGTFYSEPITTANTPPKSKTKMDDFWFCYKDYPKISYNVNYNNTHDYYRKVFAADINADYWTKNFYFQTKYPFVLENEIDIFKMDYKNSFIQNVKYKQNTNVLKQFSLRFENIEDDECRAMLLFLEKKCGYKRFIYEFPIFMKKNKVFICNNWNHVFKYKNCNDITLQLIEDPNPNVFYTENNLPYLI